MRRTIKKTIVIITLVFIAQTSFGQDKKKQIYFLSDTINVSKNNQILEITTEGAWRSYSFFCKCIPGYERNVNFDYLLGDDKGIQISKPNVTFTSWKSLADLVFKAGKKFNDQFDLVIVEVLPEKKYRANNVKLYMAPPPIVDFIKIEKNQ